jgi:hypothetical protein
MAKAILGIRKKYMMFIFVKLLFLMLHKTKNAPQAEHLV